MYIDIILTTKTAINSNQRQNCLNLFSLLFQSFSSSLIMASLLHRLIKPLPPLFLFFFACMSNFFVCNQLNEFNMKVRKFLTVLFFFLNVLHYGNSKNMMIGSFKKVETISICKTFNRQTSKLLFFFFLNKRINDNHTVDRK